MTKLITFTLQNGQKPTESENLEVRELWYKVPAVTKVLSETISQKKKDALAKWRLDVGEEKAEQILIEAQNRGKEFDAAIEKMVIEGASGIDYIDEYFKGKKIQNLQLGFIYIEKEIEVEGELIAYGYKGFMDFELISESDIITTDTKTWKKHKIDDKGNERPEWVDGDYYLQVSAYAKALGRNKAMILGTNGNSFQGFTIYDINGFCKDFDKRLLKYITEKKGKYYEQNRDKKD